MIEGTIEQWLEQEKRTLDRRRLGRHPRLCRPRDVQRRRRGGEDPRDPLACGRRRRLRARGRRRRRALGVAALMQAVRVHEGGELRHETVPDPVAGPGEVVVELRTAALNRRDLLVCKGIYPFPLPLVPGSDGAGVRRDTGEEVVIYPALDWGDREEAFGSDFQILGGPRDGTYAELVAVPEANVFPKPARLSWEEAAALPLAGLTAYRALFSRGGLRAGETVLVLGAGSGVSTFAVQLAAQAGARVLVTSSSDDKIERSRALGAEAGVNYATEDWVAAVKELRRCRPRDRLGRLDLAAVARLPAPGRTPGRLRGHRRHRGDAAGAAVLLRPVVAARDDDGQPDGLRRRCSRALESGTWRPVIDSVVPARRGCGSARAAWTQATISASWCSHAAEHHGVGGSGGSAGRLPARGHGPRAALPAARRGASPGVPRDRRRLSRPWPFGLGAAVERRAARRRSPRDGRRPRDLRSGLDRAQLRRQARRRGGRSPARPRRAGRPARPRDAASIPASPASAPI